MFEEKMNRKLVERKNRLLAGVRTSGKFTEEQIKSYVDEAEHQDGYEYWKQFKTWQSLEKDMILYFENQG
jgi:hypothetical protein